MALGFCVSRNPYTGQSEMYGSFENAQGQKMDWAQMRQLYPRLITEIEKAALEKEAQLKFPVKIDLDWDEAQNFHATHVAEATLTAQAKLKALLALYDAQKISKTNLSEHLDEAFFTEWLGSRLANVQELETLACLYRGGITVYQGVVSGVVFKDAAQAADYKIKNPQQSVILLKAVLEPYEARYVKYFSAMITVSSGLSSHAAIIARIKAIPCLTGVPANLLEQVQSGVAVVLKADGEPGIWLGQARVTKGNAEDSDFLKLLQILSQGQSLWANADTAEDVAQAQKLGAQGIGLLRTEHMVLNNSQTQRVLQAFYLLVNPEQRKLYEQPLIDGQANEFKKIFTLSARPMEGIKFPVTIRLLDFPMHEILPQPEDLPELEKLTGVAVSELQALLKIKHEENPMLGCRGVRLAMIFPELYDLQIKAVLQALQGFDPKTLEIKIMLPMVMLPREMFFWRERITALIQGTYSTCFKIGAMLEIPSACLQADEIAKAADFLSVGSNDLTQMCYGLSRDDATQIQEKYIQTQMLPQSLFAEMGFAVCELIKQACALARKTRPQIPITVCGEHAGNLLHWDFWRTHQIGLSVASPRLPILAWKFAQEAGHE